MRNLTPKSYHLSPSPCGEGWGGVLLLFLSLLAMSVSAKIVVTKTTCNNQAGNAVVVGKRITVGWQMESNVNNDRQTAYQIEIAENGANKPVFRSQKIKSKESQFIDFSSIGAYLASAQPYDGLKWRVKVWDAKKQPSEWSAWQTIHIAPQTIDAKWIGATDDPNDSIGTKSIEILKPFTLNQPAENIADAVVYVCGLGHYIMDINGQKVSDAEFAPLWTDYGKTVYYNIYDPTPALPTRGGVIRITLGNGMYNVKKDGRYAKFQHSFGAPKAIMRMIINYKDGSSQVIKTDGTEQYRLSPIVFNSIYGGESYDENMENQPLRAVKTVSAPQGKLIAQTAPPVKVMEKFGVKSWRHSQTPVSKNSTEMKDVIVCDMGQNLSGFPEITFSMPQTPDSIGTPSHTIVLTPSEKLDKNGNVTQRQTGSPHFYSYTFAGNPDTRTSENPDFRKPGNPDIQKPESPKAQNFTWHPHFSYYGFRYIQVEGAVMKGEPNPDNLPVIEELKSCFMYNSAEEYSKFEAANKLFTDTHHLIERAERSNMQSVFTDCPHREKLGWLEQDHLCGPSLLHNYNLTTFGPKFIRDIRDAQKENGQVPTTAPQYVVFGNQWGDFDESVEWGSTLVIFPFQYYEHYGDNSLIMDSYEAMRKYVDYLETQRDEEGIINFGLGDWYDYQPTTAAGFSKNTPVPLVGTAHYIYDLQLMVKAVEMKGDKTHLNIYKEKLTKAIADFNKKYFHADSLYYGNNSQCSNALPLFLGICPKGTEQGVYKNLIADVMKSGKPRLTTGDVGNRYLIQAITQKGDNKLVYDIFNHDETPGYGYQMKRDMTTLSEQWNPEFGSSLNHFMMGHLDEWLFRSMAGIRNAEGSVGLRDIVIQPFLTADNPSVKAETANLYGKIAVDATNDEIKVEIPMGCRATVITKSGKKTKVGSGKHTIQNN